MLPDDTFARVSTIRAWLAAEPAWASVVKFDEVARQTGRVRFDDASWEAFKSWVERTQATANK